MAFSSTKKDKDKGKSARLTLSKNPDNINIIKTLKVLILYSLKSLNNVFSKDLFINLNMKFIFFCKLN